MTRWQKQMNHTAIEQSLWWTVYRTVGVSLDNRGRRDCSLPVMAVITNEVWWPLDQQLDHRPRGL
ncbi:hypothetical protein LCGC14_0823610 [marine sediment metagenome]|uniref:Uncharacterized protein n=1 Tax=marine sediment metagenome TaxID=412755 RepID=A0A0F9SQN6_9ZZZZ